MCHFQVEALRTNVKDSPTSLGPILSMVVAGVEIELSSAHVPSDLDVDMQWTRSVSKKQTFVVWTTDMGELFVIEA